MAPSDLAYDRSVKQVVINGVTYDVPRHWSEVSGGTRFNRRCDELVMILGRSRWTGRFSKTLGVFSFFVSPYAARKIRRHYNMDARRLRSVYEEPLIDRGDTRVSIVRDMCVHCALSWESHGPKNKCPFSATSYHDEQTLQEKA